LPVGRGGERCGTLQQGRSDSIARTSLGIKKKRKIQRVDMSRLQITQSEGGKELFH